MRTLIPSLKSISVLLLFLLLTVTIIYPQGNNQIAGRWVGKLQIQTAQLRIVFNVEESDSGALSATMDSPDQGAFGIVVDEVKFDGTNVMFNVSSISGFYKGVFVKDSLLIRGEWNQSGMSLPLVLRYSEKPEEVKRPQEPEKPYPYLVEEVKFENTKANVTLAGTLTIPDSSGTYPAVILISGSGPQNRDEELFGHKPFLVLSDYLTRNGIAVLRYDDRGVGESTGNFKAATTKDFADDVFAAVEFLKSRKEVDENYIGLIGHSEGGLIAPMVAVESDDVKFIVLLAAPGLRGDKLLLLQSGMIQKLSNVPVDIIKKDSTASARMFDILLNEPDSVKASEKLEEIIRQEIEASEQSKTVSEADKQKIIRAKLQNLMSPWFRYFISYDPYPVLTKVKCPVLALNGEKDLQVPPEENLKLIEKALKEGVNSNYKIVKLPGLNHLFQTSKTGSPSEYGTIEETFSPEAMKIIVDWIKELSSKKK